MCGIIAVRRFDGAPVDRELLLRMRDTMVHRGPDDAGILVDGPVGLGHRRLSIVDLSPSGHQPMSNEDESLWLVFNGEIYNYVELRQRLVAGGHSFKSTTDSEVILHLYEDLGERCVHELSGMFSFIIWDARRNVMFGARDRCGIKPFYYCCDDKQFVCASEIKAIVEDPSIERLPDMQGIADFRFAGAPLNNKTFFRNISRLPPGGTIRVERSGVTTGSYWDLKFGYDDSRSQDRIIGELTELLDDAVRIHCRSDAPVGAHLSGGIDSSAVSGFAARHVDGLKNFSIRFDETDAASDESGFADLVSDAIGSKLVRKTATGSVLGELYPSLIWHMDQPAAGGGDAGFSYYAAAELAAQHVKVALTGHGGDEVFAGYPAQFRTAFGTTNMFQASPSGEDYHSVTGSKVLRVLKTKGLSGVARRVLERFARRREPGPEELWTELHCGAEASRDLLIHPDFVKALGGYSPLADYIRPFREAPTDRLLDKCLYHDLRVYLPQLLHREDRASMAVSIESRVPLLDTRVVEFAAGLTPEQKVPGLVPKAALRDAIAGVVPDEVRLRKDKVPFSIPMRRWMAGSLSPLTRQLLNSDQCLSRGVFNPDLIRTGDLSDDEKRNVLNVELWFRLFIDQDAEWNAVVRNVRPRAIVEE